ncbi:MAG: ATP-binding protein, partial [Clostridia bacterium]|nr:ATP-binding protein [Clostridia bacterium]
MNRKILAKAQAVIDERRQYAEKVALDYLKKALKNPKFEELYKKEKELMIDLTRRDVYGENVDYSILDKIKLEQEFVLKDMGLNGTDIVPNYECKICNDTGYVDGFACECLKREINKELFEYSGFTSRLASFDEKHINHPAFDLMKKWCDTNSTKINVLICGPTGTGKTYLTECIADRLIKRNRIVLFTTAFNLHSCMLNYHISNFANRDEILEPFLNAEVLIIDDLGSEPMLANITKEYLYMILNERMLKKLSTIITTNLYPNDLLEHYT